MSIEGAHEECDHQLLIPGALEIGPAGRLRRNCTRLAQTGERGAAANHHWQTHGVDLSHPRRGSRREPIGKSGVPIGQEPRPRPIPHIEVRVA